ncbi:neuronal calcium sensor 1 [Vairimorpha apis BRL 01]|uniref:Neuronal calcium sensor 1 n=1 Tax=Vairimorpha apis BRL 01 TaxID=1037528 RepID=T0MLF2_9MICR|nr:neuronal calcium sensor 1 [Vairimorpha apis BRL 01]
MGNKTSNIRSNNTDITNQFSYFPSKDVQDWAISFKKQFPCGYITLTNLEQVFKRLFPFGSCKKFVKRLFYTINISQSNQIEFHELLIAFSILKAGSSFEKLRWIFRFYDEDSDGVVSKAEMIEIAQSLVDMVSNTLDLNIDAEKAINDLFEVCENKSGFFTFEDFKELAVRKKEAFEMLTLYIC